MSQILFGQNRIGVPPQGQFQPQTNSFGNPPSSGRNRQNNNTRARVNNMKRSGPVDSHYFTFSVGRHYLLIGESDFPYSKDHLRSNYSARDNVERGDGFRVGINYLFTPQWAITFDIFSYFKKIKTRISDNSFLEESWSMQHQLIGLEYYFDPIIFSNTYGLKFSYGDYRLKYSGRYRLPDGSSAPFRFTEFDKRTVVYLIGAFYDYGDDDWGLRIGIDYLNGDKLKIEKVFDHSIGAEEDKSISPQLINLYANIRYIF